MEELVRPVKTSEIRSPLNQEQKKVEIERERQSANVNYTKEKERTNLDFTSFISIFSFEHDRKTNRDLDENGEWQLL